MNKLSRDRQVQAIAALSEGCSVRSVERLTGIHRDTILRLQGRVGEACAKLMDDEMRNLPCSRLELDEQWTFVSKKQRRLAPGDDESRMGDFWAWTCFDPESKAIPTFRLGKRDRSNANAFVADVAARMRNRVQISADGLGLYIEAVERAFGGAVDFATVVKSFEGEPIGAGRYAPPRVTEVHKANVIGNPNMDHASTSGVERSNLTNRMRVRRMTRLVDAFSRKPENLKAALSVHFAVYNYAKPHRSLKGATPAMALGVSKSRWSVGDLVALAGW